MAFDHGILNVPLAKRGNIDAQIDRYKADKAREENAQRKAVAANRRECKALIDTMPEAVVARMSARLGLTHKQYIARLRSLANGNPTRTVEVLRKIHAEAAS